MSVIYSDAWYDDMKEMVNSVEKLPALMSDRRILAAFEVVGDDASPYVDKGETIYYLIELESGRVLRCSPLPGSHDGKNLDFRFTAPATVWEKIAAGQSDPISAGLKGTIRIRGDMRFLMQNAEAVKLIVDVYGNQEITEWPQGKPPYGPAGSDG